MERARREPEGRFHSLAHLIDVPALERAFHRLRGNAAVGVDGVSKAEYEQGLEGNLEDLHRRLRTKRYLSYTHCDHALCGAHLLRELAFIVDAHGYAWAKRMKRLLLGACHQVSKRDDKMLSASEYKALQKRYRTILTQGARELPPIPPRQNGQRGKVAKSDAHNLWERMQKHETAVLRFAKHPDVAFTNNRAERDLRMAKVKQKVSGCFRTRKYAEAYCRISSYLQSMANQGYNPLVAIQIALAGRALDNMGE